ncbi:MAG: glycosyltransferase family 2 protein [Bacteroidetes bacterium]|nr:glycosyltransferase family 2 protein [Bacteroidota bacterium]
MQHKNYIAIKASPLVSVITLNWNQTVQTCQFLESTKKLKYANYEVLVCDMGSAVDPGPAIFSGKFPNTRLLKMDNAGRASGGVNWAVKQAKGDFILFINNHTEVTETLIEDLLSPFLNDNALGVTCPKIRSYHQKDIIEFAGYKPLNIVTGRSSLIGNNQRDNGQYDKLAYTHGAYTGAMMLRKTVIEKVGMFPQNFFIYFDDADLSARIKKKGFKILYQPKALVYSRTALNSSGKTAMQVYYTTRNRILYMRRNCNFFQFFVFALFFTLVVFPFNLFRFSLTRKFGHLFSFLKAILWNIKTKKTNNTYNA